MITKGQVTGIINKYKLKVRVPIFETAGLNQHQELDCSICYTPGNIDGYKVDDIVFVGFEDNNINNGIVLGKLYSEKSEENPSNYALSNSLKITGNASLPSNTTIGDINFKELKYLFTNSKWNSDDIKEIYKEISNE